MKQPSVWLLGGGFAADAYDLFAINAVMAILAKHLSETATDKGLVTTSALVGAMLGQITFGLIGDSIGRGVAFVLTLLFIFIGNTLSAWAVGTPDLFWKMAACRLVMGIGIGGDYPTAAVNTLESAADIQFQTTPEARLAQSKKMAKVFAMQGVGNLVSTIVAYLSFLLLFSENFTGDLSWRVCLGVGAIPVIPLFIARYYQHYAGDTYTADTYTTDISKQTLLLEPGHSVPISSGAVSVIIPASTNAKLITRTKLGWREVFQTIYRDYSLVVLSNSLNWFILDVIFYGNGLFTSTILNHFTNGSLSTTLEYNIYLTLISLTGYGAAIWLVGHLKNIQIQSLGFALMALVYLIIALIFEQIQHDLTVFFLMYGLTFFLTNAGPNTTTYLLATQTIDDLDVRTTASGIAAAFGKLGAIVGSFAMAQMLKYTSLPVIFYSCSALSLIGSLLAYFQYRQGVITL